MMRRVLPILLALVISLVPSLPALAQAPNAGSTDLKLEMKKKRSVVVPPADTAAGASEADAAARRMDEQRRAEELQRKATPTPPPPLDETVVEGIQGKKLQEMPRR